jgi:hypothetical protein
MKAFIKKQRASIDARCLFLTSIKTPRLSTGRGLSASEQANNSIDD